FERKHLELRGERNGWLPGSHRQLIREAHIGKNWVSPALKILQERGLLIRTKRGSYCGDNKGYASLFELTHLPIRKGDRWERPKNLWRNWRPARVRIDDEVLLLAANDA